MPPEEINALVANPSTETLNETSVLLWRTLSAQQTQS